MLNEQSDVPFPTPWPDNIGCVPMPQAEIRMRGRLHVLKQALSNRNQSLPKGWRVRYRRDRKVEFDMYPTTKTLLIPYPRSKRSVLVGLMGIKALNTIQSHYGIEYLNTFWCYSVSNNIRHNSEVNLRVPYDTMSRVQKDVKQSMTRSLKRMFSNARFIGRLKLKGSRLVERRQRYGFDRQVSSLEVSLHAYGIDASVLPIPFASPA